MNGIEHFNRLSPPLFTDCSWAALVGSPALQASPFFDFPLLPYLAPAITSDRSHIFCAAAAVRASMDLTWQVHLLASSN